MTEEPSDLAATPLLQHALEQLRLEGAIFFRSELTEPFAFESRPSELADLLHPGAERVILFHIVARGTCWVAGDDGERHWADTGDVIVLPYGDHHVIGGASPASCVAINELLEPLPWSDLPAIRHGGGGARVDLCAATSSPTTRCSIPRCASSRRRSWCGCPTAPRADWVQASVAYAATENVPSNASRSLVSTRLPELVLIEVLRQHLASAPAADHGWLAALHDPVLAPALAQLHGDPARHWTVADLAAEAAVSRSVLDERFRQVLGRSPIRYLTEWRMHLAEELLATTDLGVVPIARRVGYESEEAFSRAFKRAHGDSPGRWRARERAAAGTSVTTSTSGTTGAHQ